ncbi:MAG TPA: hypothetical protein VF755_04485 [Catenuloplanes sp.]|jgi:hypothetical protein
MGDRREQQPAYILPPAYPRPVSARPAPDQRRVPAPTVFASTPASAPPVTPGHARGGAAPAAQRAPGTLYGGGHGAGDLTTAMPPHSSLENSGSLTGHILAQGWSDTPTSNGTNTRVVLILIAVIVVMVALGLAGVLAAGESLNSLFDGLLNH